MSTSAPAVLPALDKFNLVGDFIATVIYGINIILYTGCVYILWGRSRNFKSQWILLLTSTILFILATISIGATLAQEIEAFIDVPRQLAAAQAAGLPNVLPGPVGTVGTFLDNTKTAQIVKAEVYVTIVFLQDLILIWRMYVVYGNNYLICLPFLLIEFVHIGAAYASSVLLTNPANNFFTPSVAHWSIVGWSLELTVNVCVTGAIALRLWLMGRSSANWETTTGGVGVGNKYLKTIFVLVESGFIFAATTVAIVVMYLTNNTKTLVALEVASQLAATTPFLIVVRVGLGLTHGLPLSSVVGKSRKSKSSKYASHSGGAPSTLRAATGTEITTTTGTTATTATSVLRSSSHNHHLGMNSNSDGTGTTATTGTTTMGSRSSMDVNVNMSRGLIKSVDWRRSMGSGGSEEHERDGTTVESEEGMRMKVFSPQKGMKGTLV